MGDAMGGWPLAERTMLRILKPYDRPGSCLGDIDYTVLPNKASVREMMGCMKRKKGIYLNVRTLHALTGMAEKEREGGRCYTLRWQSPIDTIWGWPALGSHHYTPCASFAMLHGSCMWAQEARIDSMSMRILAQTTAKEAHSSICI